MRKVKWTAKRFFASLRPAENGCLMWTGGKNHQGYGFISFRGRSVCTHRFSWLLSGHHRRLLKGHKYEIAHICHNKLCCNPSHLVKVTNSENKLMSSRAGRLPKGLTHHRAGAKLNRRQVAAAKKAIANGDRTSDIARRFSVGFTAIHKMKHGLSWKDGQY